MINEHTITIKGKQYQCNMPVLELTKKPIKIITERIKCECLLTQQLKAQNERLKALLSAVLSSKSNDINLQQQIEKELYK